MEQATHSTLETEMQALCFPVFPCGRGMSYASRTLTESNLAQERERFGGSYIQAPEDIAAMAASKQNQL